MYFHCTHARNCVHLPGSLGGPVHRSLGGQYTAHGKATTRWLSPFFAPPPGSDGGPFLPAAGGPFFAPPPGSEGGPFLPSAGGAFFAPPPGSDGGPFLPSAGGPFLPLFAGSAGFFLPPALGTVGVRSLQWALSLVAKAVESTHQRATPGSRTWAAGSAVPSSPSAPPLRPCLPWPGSPPLLCAPPPPLQPSWLQLRLRLSPAKQRCVKDHRNSGKFDSSRNLKRRW